MSAGAAAQVSPCASKPTPCLEQDQPTSEAGHAVPLRPLNTDPRVGRLNSCGMGQDALQVVPAELVATAGEWGALSAQLVAAPPSPGPPFQPTTAAVNAVNAAIGVEAADFAARTQETVGGVATAADGYVSQEVTSADAMSDVIRGMVV